ncbi:MAG: hypothetical protein ABL904_03150, partial [Hyphomicrobiaceae bacterium]
KAPPAVAPVAPKAAVKAEKKPASACKGLEKGACEANTECTYVVPTKANKATGKVQAAYCKKAPPAPKKAAAKAPAAPAAAKAPAAAAPAPAAKKP